ncbi:EamA family transporter [Baekduia soli]|uniref:EamA family transporter n=1 Tax=Baekduia soli TaxID=496014 RepID=A0A5B8U0P7_9ACTN|nr:EamA family transporter [Baekduia soli]QEC46561.1 EamA family transporter [Baekduia soli]
MWNNRRIPAARLNVLLAALCFGTTGTAQALGPDASAVTVGAARIAVGAVLLLLVRRAVAREPAARWARGPAAVAALGVAGYQLCFFAAVKDTGVAVGTVVALGSAPALAGAGGWLLDRRPPGRAWLAATTLACAGVALLALAGGGSQVSAPGVALAVGAGASYALFTLAAKRLLDAGHAVESVMACAFGWGAVLLVPVLVLGDLSWVASAGGAAMALWLGAIPTAVAYLLFARGLRHLPASEVATLTLGEPVTAAVLGAVVLGERPGALAVAGILVILGGLAVLALPRARTAPAPAEVPV